MNFLKSLFQDLTWSFRSRSNQIEILDERLRDLVFSVKVAPLNSAQHTSALKVLSNFSVKYASFLCGGHINSQAYMNCHQEVQLKIASLIQD